MAAGVTDHVWTLKEIAGLLEGGSEAQPAAPESARPSGNGHAEPRRIFRN